MGRQASTSLYSPTALSGTARSIPAIAGTGRRRRAGRARVVNSAVQTIQRLEAELQPAEPKVCRRGHDRRVTGYVRNNRYRCTACDELARRQPLTEHRRQASSTNSEGWQAILSQGLGRLYLAMLRLSYHERRVVELRLGLDRDPQEPRTLREVGELLEPPRTRQNVDQLEKRAMRVLLELLELPVS